MGILESLCRGGATHLKNHGIFSSQMEIPENVYFEFACRCDQAHALQRDPCLKESWGQCSVLVEMLPFSFITNSSLCSQSILHTTLTQVHHLQQLCFNSEMVLFPTERRSFPTGPNGEGNSRSGPDGPHALGKMRRKGGHRGSAASGHQFLLVSGLGPTLVSSRAGSQALLYPPHPWGQIVVKEPLLLIFNLAGEKGAQGWTQRVHMEMGP